MCAPPKPSATNFDGHRCRTLTAGMVHSSSHCPAIRFLRNPACGSGKYTAPTGFETRVPTSFAIGVFRRASRMPQVCYRPGDHLHGLGVDEQLRAGIAVPKAYPCDAPPS